MLAKSGVLVFLLFVALSMFCEMHFGAEIESEENLQESKLNDDKIWNRQEIRQRQNWKSRIPGSPGIFRRRQKSILSILITDPLLFNRKNTQQTIRKKESSRLKPDKNRMHTKSKGYKKELSSKCERKNYTAN